MYVKKGLRQILTNFMFMIYTQLNKTPPIGSVKQIKVNMVFSTLRIEIL